MSANVYGIIVIAYVLIMLGVGYWCMRQTKNVGDFFIGGRKLGPWMSAFAYGTTYFSAVLFIGYAGKLGWGFGIHTMWIVIGNTLIGTILAWKLLAGRTREMTARLNAITMPEFLAARFGSKGLQIISALVVFIFLVPYSASVYMGLSYLFEKTFNMPYGTALIFLSALTGVYLVMGGYFAVAVSDFIRGIVEFGGVLLMVYLLAQWKGGFGVTTTALMSDNTVMAPGLAKAVALGPESMQLIVPGSLILLSLVLITSFGPWALPQMVQKFYSIRSKADVSRAMMIAGVFALFMSFGAYYSGALTHLYYADGLPQGIFEAGKPNLDMLMPYFITTELPHMLVLIILLLVFSASMSSLSSLVLVSSSAISIDIYGAFANAGVDAGTSKVLRVIFTVLLVVGAIFALAMVVAMGVALYAGQYPLMWRYFALALCAVGLSAVFRRLSRTHTEEVKLVLMRMLCAVFVALSLVIAMKKVDVIVNLMIMSWGTLAGVFLAPYLYGLFWKRTTKAGVYSGIIAGLTTAVTLFLLWGKDGIPLAGAITMFLPLIVVPVVSLLTPPPPHAMIEAAFTDAPVVEPTPQKEVTA